MRTINEGKVPIYEPGLEDLLRKQLAAGRLRATTDMDAMLGAEVSFLCVGTPSRKDGSLDLKYVRSAARAVGERLARMDRRHTVVVREHRHARHHTGCGPSHLGEDLWTPIGDRLRRGHEP